MITPPTLKTGSTSRVPDGALGADALMNRPGEQDCDAPQRLDRHAEGFAARGAGLIRHWRTACYTASTGTATHSMRSARPTRKLGRHVA